MDDAQQIVLVALQQAGIQVPGDAKGSQELGSSGLVSICAQGVALLRGVSPIPVTLLPTGTAERFRVCTDLAGAIKLLGYQGDLSFHQFLYPTHTDTHRLLRFLLDQLSKSSQSSRTRKTSRGATAAPPLRNRLSSTVQKALVEAHASAHTDEGRERHEEELPFQTCPLRTTVNKTVAGVAQKKPTLVTLQAKPRNLLIPSLLQLNAKCAADLCHSHILSKGERVPEDMRMITHGEFLPHQFLCSAKGGEPVEGEQLFAIEEGDTNGVGSGEFSEREDVETTVKSFHVQLQEQLIDLVTQADKMKVEVQDIQQHISVLKEQEEAGSQRTRQTEKEIAVLRDAVKMALGLSPPPSECLQQLQVQVKVTEEHLVALQAEWEAVRQPLEDKKAELEKESLSGQEELQEKLRKIKEMRQQLKELSTKLQVREEQAWTLRSELKEIGTLAKHSSYVHRITELVKNSQKQEKDIAKIVTDTRELQRESNSANDRLRRTYALVDELVFRDAKKDAVCRQAYRQLSTIHETFADIVDKVMEMDKTGREIAELQAQLEELQKSSLDVTSVQSDLDAVASENRLLEKRLSVALTMQQTLNPKNLQSVAANSV